MSEVEFQQEVLQRLIAIDYKADSMEDSLAWLVRANAPELKEELLKAFGKSTKRAAVYLALDGAKNVNAIAASLGMKPQNVTRELKWLKRRRLVDVADASGDGKLYKKKFFDAVVGLSTELMRQFELDENGRSVQ